MTKMLKPAYTRTILRRFENAVRDHAFRGTIPAHESDEALQVLRKIDTEYTKAKSAILNMIDTLNGVSK